MKHTRKYIRSLTMSQKLLRIMADAGVSISALPIPGKTVKAYRCTCGSRHSRASDLIHHFYTVHFLGKVPLENPPTTTE